MNEILNIELLLVFLGICGVLVHKRSKKNILALDFSSFQEFKIMGIFAVTGEFLHNAGVWISNNPWTTTAIVAGVVVVGGIFILSAGAGAAGGAAGAAIATDTLSKVTTTTPTMLLDAASHIGGSVVELAVPVTTQVALVLTETEVPRVLFTLIAGGTGLAVAWATGVWTAELTPFVNLTDEQYRVLEQLAEELVRSNPRLLDELFGNYSPENFEIGLQKLGELSGILDKTKPINSKLVAQATALLLEEPSTTFSDIVQALENTSNQKTKYKVLLLFHLTTIILGLTEGIES